MLPFHRLMQTDALGNILFLALKPHHKVAQHSQKEMTAQLLRSSLAYIITIHQLDFQLDTLRAQFLRNLIVLHFILTAVDRKTR